MSELLPCPFCGGGALEKFDLPIYGESAVIMHTREDCFLVKTYAGGIFTYEYERGNKLFITRMAELLEVDEQEAIKAWNTRAVRTCTMTHNEAMSGDEIYPTDAYTCSSCGWTNLVDKPCCCENCGAKVVSE